MKIAADSVKRWLKRLERDEPEAHDELLAVIEGFEVAEDAFCQARDLLRDTMLSLGFPERGTKGDGVRENIERIERYIKKRGYIRPARPRGRKFDMRCPEGPSGMLAAAGPETEMTVEFEEGELVANRGDPTYDAVDLRENPPAFVEDQDCWDRAVRAAEHAGATDRYAFANWWYQRYCG